MRINKGKNRLRVSRRKTDGASPMESLANLVDVMLVFACGLIIALIAAYNVDVTKVPYKVDSIKENAGQTQKTKEDLQEMGKIYKDPDTGKLYVIEDEE